MKKLKTGWWNRLSKSGHIRCKFVDTSLTMSRTVSLTLTLHLEIDDDLSRPEFYDRLPSLLRTGLGPMKRIAFGGKPVPKPGAASADDWVSDRSNHRLEPNKRLTIDVPLSLHQRVKSQCAIQGLKMADVIRDLLDERFPGERTQDALRIDESTPAVANTTL